MAGGVQDVDLRHRGVASGSELPRRRAREMEVVPAHAVVHPVARGEIRRSGDEGAGSHPVGVNGDGVCSQLKRRWLLSAGISVANSGVGPAMVIAFQSEGKSRVAAWLLETRARSWAMRQSRQRARGAHGTW